MLPWDGKASVAVRESSLRYLAGVMDGASLYFRSGRDGDGWCAFDLQPVLPPVISRNTHQDLLAVVHRNRAREERADNRPALSDMATGHYVRVVSGGGPGTGKRR